MTTTATTQKPPHCTPQVAPAFCCPPPPVAVGAAPLAQPRQLPRLHAAHLGPQGWYAAVAHPRGGC
eukprot:scaffold173728_cov17-Tisochrysis_lutea.AAC.1